MLFGSIFEDQKGKEEEGEGKIWENKSILFHLNRCRIWRSHGRGPDQIQRADHCYKRKGRRNRTNWNIIFRRLWQWNPWWSHGVVLICILGLSYETVLLSILLKPVIKILNYYQIKEIKKNQNKNKKDFTDLKKNLVRNCHSFLK